LPAASSRRRSRVWSRRGSRWPGARSRRPSRTRGPRRGPRSPSLSGARPAVRGRRLGVAAQAVEHHADAQQRPRVRRLELRRALVRAERGGRSSTALYASPR
jgi:hypothetical protein